MAKKFILQPWENTCICGRSISDGGTYLRDPWIVSIYEEFEYQKARFPLCLGALISHHHVLTSKMCFGRLEIELGCTLHAHIPNKKIGRVFLLFE